MSLIDWMVGKVADRFGLTRALDEQESSLAWARPSLRFKATAAGKPTLFVYGLDEAEACARLPADRGDATLEPAGYVEESGVVRIPPEETRAVVESTRDDRKAPGA